MTRIDRASRLAQILRSRLADSSGKATRGGAGSKVASTQPDSGQLATGGQGDAGDGERIKRIIAQRVSALSENDPDRKQKAFRIFLESVLLQEFGLHLIEDAGFQRLVDQVQGQMTGDSDLSQAVDDAASLLLAQPQSPGNKES